MLDKILIANRGEIAVRIIRSCRDMGIQTVSVYSEADKDALHVKMADEAVCIGPAASKDSYLNMENIISATVLTGAQAIHPGYGFLSESSKFAYACKKCNIVFIGPDPETIDIAGNKSNAKEMMKKIGVPVIPGSDGAVSNVNEGMSIAEKIGFPVLIKASSGGGGRGIRLVRNKDEFPKEFNSAAKEAKAAFGDDSLYVEKFIQNPRHIEVQIFGDNYGNIIYLGERDCSVQRRNQKILEEAPSSFLSDNLRKKMGETAVKAAKAVGYKNAGTVEFLVDKYGQFYFMEMNTRVQVEHPITEMVTGMDIVKMQIHAAAGETLNIKQNEVNLQGHAIECRINAENPLKNFRPSPGKIDKLFVPGGIGIRFDSAIYQGYTIPPVYDSMIGKLIAYGRDRDEAMSRMRRALSELLIEGIDTNIDFLIEILNNDKFINNNFDTGFVENELLKGVKE